MTPDLPRPKALTSRTLVHLGRGKGEETRRVSTPLLCDGLPSCEFMTHSGDWERGGGEGERGEGKGKSGGEE